MLPTHVKMEELVIQKCRLKKLRQRLEEMVMQLSLLAANVQKIVPGSSVNDAFSNKMILRGKMYEKFIHRFYDTNKSGFNVTNDTLYFSLFWPK